MICFKSASLFLTIHSRGVRQIIALFLRVRNLYQANQCILITCISIVFIPKVLTNTVAEEFSVRVVSWISVCICLIKPFP